MTFPGSSIRVGPWELAAEAQFPQHQFPATTTTNSNNAAIDAVTATRNDGDAGYGNNARRDDGGEADIAAVTPTPDVGPSKMRHEYEFGSNHHQDEVCD